MMRKQGTGNERTPDYTAVLVEQEPGCRFESFGLAPDCGRSLFDAGIQGMGIDRLRHPSSL